jgi:5-methylcytosine-specific restriction endonuclease McrA
LASSTARGYGQAHRRARLLVLARDRYVCQWCGAYATEADHLGAKVPDPARMVASCRTCNARRGARKAQANRRARTPLA